MNASYERAPRKGSRIGLGLAVLGVSLILSGGLSRGWAEGGFAFSDPVEDTQRFHRWYDEIELTPEQEEVMKAALEPLAAPCCKDRSAYTCCCKCNLGRSWWGLSKYLITEEGAGVEEVRAAVEEWFGRVNPDGFSGDSCYTGGCARSFRDNGCGGMSAAAVRVE